jgi:hypothetical protein
LRSLIEIYLALGKGLEIVYEFIGLNAVFDESISYEISFVKNRNGGDKFQGIV